MTLIAVDENLASSPFDTFVLRLGKSVLHKKSLFVHNYNEFYVIQLNRIFSKKIY